MFYSQFILAKKGPLGTIWIAAHLERKLKKNQVADTDIGVSVDSILFPEVPIALRLSSHLLLGVVKIYSRKVNYLFNDCSETLVKIKQAFRSTAVDLPPEESTAPYHSITLPETIDFEDLEFPDSSFSFGNYIDHHVTTREQITLQDPVEDPVYIGSQFGLDERFGDGDAAQTAFDFDEDIFADEDSRPDPSSSSTHKEENVSAVAKDSPGTRELESEGRRSSATGAGLCEEGNIHPSSQAFAGHHLEQYESGFQLVPPRNVTEQVHTSYKEIQTTDLSGGVSSMDRGQNILETIDGGLVPEKNENSASSSFQNNTSNIVLVAPESALELPQMVIVKAVHNQDTVSTVAAEDFSKACKFGNAMEKQMLHHSLFPQQFNLNPESSGQASSAIYTKQPLLGSQPLNAITDMLLPMSLEGRGQSCTESQGRYMVEQSTKQSLSGTIQQANRVLDSPILNAYHTQGMELQPLILETSSLHGYLGSQTMPPALTVQADMYQQHSEIVNACGQANLIATSGNKETPQIPGSNIDPAIQEGPTEELRNVNLVSDSQYQKPAVAFPEEIFPIVFQQYNAVPDAQHEFMQKVELPDDACTEVEKSRTGSSSEQILEDWNSPQLQNSEKVTSQKLLRSIEELSHHAFQNPEAVISNRSASSAAELPSCVVLEKHNQHIHSEVDGQGILHECKHPVVSGTPASILQPCSLVKEPEKHSSDVSGYPDLPNDISWANLESGRLSASFLKRQGRSSDEPAESLHKSEAPCSAVVVESGNIRPSSQIPECETLRASADNVSEYVNDKERPDAMSLEEGCTEALKTASLRSDGSKKRHIADTSLVLKDVSTSRRRASFSSKIMDDIPDDDDVLASILGRTPAFKIKETPVKPVSSKRRKITSKPKAPKRKALIDIATVLHSDVIRQQLENTDDIRRVRKKVPCSKHEIWTIEMESKGEQVFFEPSVPGLCLELRDIYNNVRGLKMKAHHKAESKEKNVQSQLADSCGIITEQRQIPRSDQNDVQDYPQEVVSQLVQSEGHVSPINKVQLLPLHTSAESETLDNHSVKILQYQEPTDPDLRNHDQKMQTDISEGKELCFQQIAELEKERNVNISLYIDDKKESQHWGKGAEVNSEVASQEYNDTAQQKPMEEALLSVVNDPNLYKQYDDLVPVKKNAVSLPESVQIAVTSEHLASARTEHEDNISHEMMFQTESRNIVEQSSKKSGFNGAVCLVSSNQAGVVAETCNFGIPTQFESNAICSNAEINFPQSPLQQHSMPERQSDTADTLINSCDNELQHPTLLNETFGSAASIESNMKSDKKNSINEVETDDTSILQNQEKVFIRFSGESTKISVLNAADVTVRQQQLTNVSIQPPLDANSIECRTDKNENNVSSETERNLNTKRKTGEEPLDITEKNRVVKGKNLLDGPEDFHKDDEHSHAEFDQHQNQGIGTLSNRNRTLNASGHDRERITDFLDQDDDLQLECEDYSNEHGCGESVQENNGWSARTRAVSKYLKTMYENMEPSSHGGSQRKVGLNHLLTGKTRKEAARMFFETLVLKTRDYVHVEQKGAFEDVSIFPRTKLMKASF